MTKTPEAGVKLLLVLLLVQGSSGVFGGLALVLDPTGAAIGLPLDLLEGSVFADYLVPGIVLLVLLGIAPLFVAGAVLKRRPRAWIGSLAVGVALMLWIAVQVLVVGYQPEPPLQAVYGTLGLAIALTSLAPSVRSALGAGTPGGTARDDTRL